MLLLLLFILAAVCCLYQYSMEQHRSVFRTHFSTFDMNCLKKIAIHPDDLFTNSETLYWEDGGKEVVYQHVLYDIVQIERREHEIILYVIQDQQEEKLRELFRTDYDKVPATLCLKLLKQLIALEYLLDDGAHLFHFHVSIVHPHAHPRSIVAAFIAPFSVPPDFFV